MMSLNAQVGIGTTSPHASSMLDVSSTSKGMLTPRMTTVQRNTITTPADGLIIYDTDLKSFYHYNSTTSSWVKINSDVSGRTNFKRIKSTDVLATVLAAELAAGGNSKYLLNTNTLYEINGTINVDLPIDLNNAYVIGLDTGEDKLIKASGTLFSGSGGSIRNVTLQATSGAVFALTGTAADSFIFRDAIVTTSQNVGTISGFGLVFSSVVQYIGNATGVTYNNIAKLLLSNIGWFGNNTGTYEKLTGTFDLVQKQSGFTEVSGTAIGFDVSSNPIISGDAVMDAVVFTGTNSTGYVNPYTGTGTFSGYNFTNKWTVSCPGIPFESDRFASGNTYLDRTITYPTISFPSTSIAYKIPGTTISTNLFRMSDGGLSNRLVYNGKRKKTFIVSSTISMQASGSGTTDFLFYFVKFTAAGAYTFVVSSETFVDSNSSYVQSFPITGTVELAAGEYVELYAQRINGSNKTLTINSFNMSLR